MKSFSKSLPLGLLMFYFLFFHKDSQGKPFIQPYLELLSTAWETIKWK